MKILLQATLFVSFLGLWVLDSSAAFETVSVKRLCALKESKSFPTSKTRAIQTVLTSAATSQDANHQNDAVLVKERRRTASRFDNVWMTHFEEAKAFREEHGHCSIPGTYPPNPPLGTWAHRLRSRHQAMTENDEDYLTGERIQSLNAIGFSWDGPAKDMWQSRYEELQAFRSQHGHCIVPRSKEHKQYLLLARWVRHQRSLYRSGLLSQNRIRLLQEIGFCWNVSKELAKVRLAVPSVFQNKWMARYQEFKTLLSESPQDYKKNASASMLTWIGYQRGKYHKGLLEQDRVRLLDEIGFLWAAKKTKKQRQRPSHQERWQQRYEELKQFHDEHGHCNVPACTVNAALKRWIQAQRLGRKKGTLKKDRAEQLDKIGFLWAATEK